MTTREASPSVSTTAVTFLRPSRVWIPVKDLYLDCPEYYVIAGIPPSYVTENHNHYGYQRDTWKHYERWVVDKAENFSEGLFSEPTHVSPRVVDGVGKYAIVDGGGRWYIAQKLGIDKIECTVHADLIKPSFKETIKAEADFFQALQASRRKMTTTERYNDAIARGLSIPKAVNKAVRAAGYNISTTKKGVNFIAALEHCLRMEVVDLVMFTLADINKGGQLKYTNGYIAGIGYLFGFMRGNLDVNRIRKILTDTTETRVFNEINEKAGVEIHPRARPKKVAFNLAKKYNLRQPKSRQVNLERLERFCDEVHPWSDQMSINEKGGRR